MQNKDIRQVNTCNSNKEINNLEHSEQANKFFKEIDKIEYKMDNGNKKAYNLLKTEGVNSSVEHMFRHPKTGEKMDYATMRYFYG